MKLKHVGVSSIRIYNADRLRAMKEPEIICDHSEPIAAMVPHALYLAWQALLTKGVEATGPPVHMSGCFICEELAAPVGCGGDGEVKWPVGRPTVLLAVVDARKP